MLADPRIFVLDEATSSIDTKTEALIQEAISTLLEGRTSFIIAHRLSTIRKADLILVVKAGKIIERGTHQQLMDLGAITPPCTASSSRPKPPKPCWANKEAKKHPRALAWGCFSIHRYSHKAREALNALPNRHRCSAGPPAGSPPCQGAGGWSSGGGVAAGGSSW